MKLNDLACRLPSLPEHVLAGVSGGADSVALLHLLRLQGLRLSAVHVNHGLRGEASDGDEAFVRSLCEAQGVPLQVFRLTPPKSPGEGWARQERYRCFREAMAQCGAEALVLAHHRDDQAETLLLHLMRGAGLTGLNGMAADSRMDGMRVLRPLLALSREELREALTQADIPWREDASNEDTRYLRNAVRQELLPMMERLSPGSGERMAAASALLQADEAVLRQQTDAFLRRWAMGLCLRLEPLLAQPEGLQRRILRRWWQLGPGGGREERSLSREQTEALMILMQGKAGDRCNLPGGWHGQRGWTHLHLVSPEASEAFSVRLDGEIPEGCVIRTRLPGDWLQLPAGRKNLQDFLVDHKVDAPFRNGIPLLARGSEVLSAAGVWPQRIHWTGDMPWQKTISNEHHDKGE